MNEDTTDKQKTFGTWIRQIRMERGLTLQELALQGEGLDIATMSRSENNRVAITLLTATRICDALNLDVNTVIQYFIDDAPEQSPVNTMVSTPMLLLHMSSYLSKNPSFSPEQPMPAEKGQEERYIVTVQDVNEFLLLFRNNRTESHNFLLFLMNTVIHYNNLYIQEMEVFRPHPVTLRMPSYTQPYTLIDINRMLYEYGLSNIQLVYPKELFISDIEHMYERKGVLILEDATHVIDKSLSNVQKSLESSNNKVIDHLFVRLSQTSLERCKLNDIIELDNLAHQRGALLKGYWLAAQIIKEIQQRKNNPSPPLGFFPDLDELEQKVINIYIFIARWLYVNRRPELIKLDN